MRVKFAFHLAFGIFGGNLEGVGLFLNYLYWARYKFKDKFSF